MAPDLYSFRELWRQYRACRRNKRVTRNALAFEADAEANLLALQRELREHTWRPGTSICFVTDGPKPREVFAADFRDRIVHHLLVSRLEPTFERGFIHDSFACRKGKGTLAGSDRLMAMLRRVTANGRRPAWALRLDVASFFPSIHKRTLYRIIRRRVRDPELRWLTRVILFHDPTRDYRFNAVGPRRPGLRGGGAETRRGRFRPSPTSGRYPIPARKSLFHGGNRRGLPIGNLTSQFWANVYLDELDQFVKRRLGCRFYLRYVDDLCLLSTDPAELLRWRAEIEHFLRERLQLALRAEVAEPRPGGRGVPARGGITACRAGRPCRTCAVVSTSGRARTSRSGGAVTRPARCSALTFAPRASATRLRRCGRPSRRTPVTCGTGARTASGSASGTSAPGSRRSSRATSGRSRSAGPSTASRPREPSPSSSPS